MITFGFFDCSVDDLRRDEAEQGYDEQMRRIEPFVASTGTSGLFDVVADYAAA